MQFIFMVEPKMHTFIRFDQTGYRAMVSKTKKRRFAYYEPIALDLAKRIYSSVGQRHRLAVYEVGNAKKQRQ